MLIDWLENESVTSIRNAVSSAISLGFAVSALFVCNVWAVGVACSRGSSQSMHKAIIQLSDNSKTNVVSSETY